MNLEKHLDLLYNTISNATLNLRNRQLFL